MRLYITYRGATFVTGANSNSIWYGRVPARCVLWALAACHVLRALAIGWLLRTGRVRWLAAARALRATCTGRVRCLADCRARCTLPALAGWLAGARDAAAVQ